MNNIENLKAKRNQHTTKIFWLCFNIVFIFLVPALLAVYFGKKMDTQFNGGEQKFVNITLVASFLFSWVIVVLYYKKLSKSLNKIDEQIRVENAQN